MSKLATVRMKGDDVAEVLVYDVIGADWFGDGITAKDFRAQLKGIKAKSINLRINSPGGSVTEGAAMLAALDEWKGEIVVDVDGLAASAASVLMMAGDKVRVASNALVMIHEATVGVMGRAEDMRRMADLLDKVNEQVIDTYLRKSTASREQLREWMSAETWFAGKEAVDAGLADEVTGAVAVAACAIPERFGYKHAPKQMAAAGPTPAELAAHSDRRKWLFEKMHEATEEKTRLPL